MSLPLTFKIDTDSPVPVFQQIADQIRFALQTDELGSGERLPSIRELATELDVASNTVAKAYRQLEFRGLIAARDRSGFVTLGTDGGRYQARGVSADKSEVHSVVDHLDPGVFAHAFCKVTEDFLSGDPDKCNLIHSDGSGTKSIIAYLHYKETGDPSVFHGIAQDSIVMNLDDLLCVGIQSRILLSNTINRNALNCPGEVVNALIEGSESFLASLRDHGVNIYSGGGETADVGDLTGTVVVDSCAVAIARKDQLLAAPIQPGLAIVGLASAGQSIYEDKENSGIGSNGLTSARHDMLSHYYAERYPESFDPNVPRDLVYCGPYRLEDKLEGSGLSIGEALLSPTRSYAPVVYRLLQEMPDSIKSLIHCSGGAQTKCMKFGPGVHFVKDNLFTAPPVFEAIQSASNTNWQEMFKVFNMGHRMEVYCEASEVAAVIDVASSYGIQAQQIGFTEAHTADSSALTLSYNGKTYRY